MEDRSMTLMRDNSAAAAGLFLSLASGHDRDASQSLAHDKHVKLQAKFKFPGSQQVRPLDPGCCRGLDSG